MSEATPRPWTTGATKETSDGKAVAMCVAGLREGSTLVRRPFHDTEEGRAYAVIGDIDAEIVDGYAQIAFRLESSGR